MASTIGWMKMSVGRFLRCRSLAPTGRLSSSNVYLPSVSCNDFSFCCFSSIGAYISRRNKKAHTITRVRQIHHQLNLETMIPPNNGPSEGPSTGPNRYHPNIDALSCGSYMSLIVSPPRAIPTDPKYLDKVLSAINTPAFGLRAGGCGYLYQGPIPREMTKLVVVAMSASSDVFKSSAI